MPAFDNFKPEVLERLTAVWREVLGATEVDAMSDFFRLGGDSLKATMMVQAIESEFGVLIEEIDIFDQHRIVAVATLVQSRLAELDEGVL